MSDVDLTKHPHRRFNPLLREWILVSPHRTDRPWQGQVETAAPNATPQYDPACYMCPGNKRSTGAANPDYGNVFVFDNDFPALLSNTPAGDSKVQAILVSQTETGICGVLCFSPRHDFPALLSNTPAGDSNVQDLLVAQTETGICRVLCFSPRHDLTLSQMEIPGIRLVVEAWIAQVQDLGARKAIK
jgi:UDPglucose--hexose-1-phosphate uridylyltransferase